MPTLTHQPFLSLVSDGKVTPVPTGPDRTHVDQSPPSTPPPTKRRRVTPSWQGQPETVAAVLRMEPPPSPEERARLDTSDGATDAKASPSAEPATGAASPPEGVPEMAAKKTKRGPKSKLSDTDRARIVARARKGVAARRKGLDGETYGDIAKAYGISPSYVQNLITQDNTAAKAKPARVADAQVATAMRPKRNLAIEANGLDVVNALGALIDARVEARVEALVDARVKAAFLRFAQQGVG